MKPELWEFEHRYLQKAWKSSAAGHDSEPGGTREPRQRVSPSACAEGTRPGARPPGGHQDRCGQDQALKPTVRRFCTAAGTGLHASPGSQSAALSPGRPLWPVLAASVRQAAAALGARPCLLSALSARLNCPGWVLGTRNGLSSLVLAPVLGSSGERWGAAG